MSKKTVTVNEEKITQLDADAIESGWTFYKAAWRIFKAVYNMTPAKGSDSRSALASCRHALRYKRAYPTQLQNLKNVADWVTAEAAGSTVAARIVQEEEAKSKTKRFGTTGRKPQAPATKAPEIGSETATKSKTGRKTRSDKGVKRGPRGRKGQLARIAELEAELAALRS
jgi:hypothetical protein